MWLTNLKIAIIDQNIDKINQLLDTPPQLENPKEIEESIYLLKEASNLLHTLKETTSISIQQMKKNIEFLKSTREPNIGNFDIKL